MFVHTTLTVAFGFIERAPIVKASISRMTSGIANGATKPILPVFDAAPAAIPER